jgi:hypothetical protein
MRAATTLATLATGAVFSVLPAASGFEIVGDHRNLQVEGGEEAQRALMHLVSLGVILVEICMCSYSPRHAASSWNVAGQWGIDSVILYPRGFGTYIFGHYPCLVFQTS